MNQVPIRINETWWVLKVGCDLPDEHGTCLHDAQVLEVSRGDACREGLSSAVHECLHAIYPFLDEQPVANGEVAVMNTIDAYLSLVGGRIVYGG